MKEKFLVIDANSLIHRGYHALPPLSNSKGQPLNGVYGFFMISAQSTTTILSGSEIISLNPKSKASLGPFSL